MALSIQLWNETWKSGKLKNVSDEPGTLYMQTIWWGFIVHCIVVPSGKAIRLHMEPDGSGKKTYWLYEGYYPDLSWYRNWDTSRMQNGYAIEVKDVGFDLAAFSTIYGGTSQVDKGDYSDFSWFYHKHVKSDDADDSYFEGDDDFQNDSINSIYVPKFHSAKVYENKNGGGKVIECKAGFTDLTKLNFGRKTSSILLAAEDLELVDIVYDWNAQTKKSEDKYLAHEEVYNDTSLPTTPQVELSASIDRTNEYDFNEEEGTSVTVGAEAEVGFLGTGGEVESEVEESVEVGFGQSTSETRTYEISASGDIQLPGWTTATAVLTFEMEKVTVPVKRTWKSTTTGETTYDEGTQTYDNAVDIRITYQDMAYVPNDTETEDEWKEKVKDLQYN